MKVTVTSGLELYHRLADGIGDQLLVRRRPELVPLHELLSMPPPGRCAVYVAIGGDGTVLYAGSVRRARPAAVAARVREHLSEGHKAATWDALWVLPVRITAPVLDVRRAEGRVITLLQVPPQNKTMPARAPSKYW